MIMDNANREELFGSSSSSKRQQQQHQQQQQQQQMLQVQNNNAAADLDSEYVSALRATSEAMDIGRATVAQMSQQTEQLTHTEQIAEEASYKLDRAGRVLRGMTWSGWVANMFSNSGSDPPPSQSQQRQQVRRQEQVRQQQSPPLTYDIDHLALQYGIAGINDCKSLMGAIQNYHCNLKVLEACETQEQIDTCQSICESMYNSGVVELGRLRIKIKTQKEQQYHNQQQQSPQQRQQQYHVVPDALFNQLESDFKTLRKRQMSRYQTTGGNNNQPSNNNNHENNTNELLSQSTPTRNHFMNNSNTTSTRARQQYQKQDDHLNALSSSLGELQGIATNLNEQSAMQKDILDSLHSHSDIIHDKTKMVTRRTERLIENKSWNKTTKEFLAHVQIKHLATNMYVEVANDTIRLTDTYHPLSCVFAVYKKQGQIVGFKSQSTRKWLGQTMFGNLAVTSNSFGKREEWETDKDNISSGNLNIAKTQLLCASAAWGTGSFLQVKPGNTSIYISSTNSAVLPPDNNRNNQAAWFSLQEVTVR